MKKRRKLTASLGDKIRSGRQRESPGKIPVTDCVREALVSSADITATDQLVCSKELTPSPNQRKLLSSLQYNKNLLKYLNDDRQKQSSFCDLVIIVDGKEFIAHKVVVAVGSSYFHAYFSKNPSTNIVILDHVTHSVFRHLLEFLYTSEFFVYNNEIPLVLEAAKFLDIIDAVKLLNSESISTSQSEEQTESLSEIETFSELAAKAPSNHQCTLCSRNFCYKKALENHLSRAHPSSVWGNEHGLKMVERSKTSTRRSMRNRKCPAKFDQSDNESAPESNLDQVPPGKENGDSNNDSESTGNEYNTDEDRQEEDTSGDDTRSEEQNEREPDDSQEPGDLAGNIISEGSLSTYIPVIVQNRTKKSLQCPKCDKTFDRAGKKEWDFLPSFADGGQLESTIMLCSCF